MVVFETYFYFYQKSIEVRSPSHVATVSWLSYRDVCSLSVCLLLCVCPCGFVEGSVARAHGLLWGWLNAASLFAYQITCGQENADLHGRKHTGFVFHLTGPRLEWEGCMAVCMCVCVSTCGSVRQRGRQQRAF